MYQLLISEQERLADTDLNTICLVLLEEGKGNRLNFRDVGFKIINGSIMVLMKYVNEVGACHAFCFYLKVKRVV